MTIAHAYRQRGSCGNRIPGLIDPKALGSFLPTYIENLSLWLRSDIGAYTDAGKTTLAANGEKVYIWADQSGNGNDSVQSGVDSVKPEFVTNVVNSYPAIRFDGDAKMRVASALTLNGADQPFSLFLVVKADSTAASICVGSFADASDASAVHTFLEHVSSQYRIFRRDDGDSYASPSFGTPDTNWNYFSIVFTGTTISVWKNGAQILTDQAMNVGTLSIDEISIGSFRYSSSPANYWDGDIAEIAVYISAFGSSDRQRVEQYMADRYAIS